MDTDLANYSLSLDPMQRQMMLAEVARTRKRGEGQDLLAEGNRKAHQFDQMAAILQMSNNPGAAAAASSMAKSATAQNKPLSLGAQGFMDPTTGSFVPSSIYEDEQRARREDRKDAREEASLNRQSVLRQTLGARADAQALAEEGRNQRAEDQRLLRLTLGSRVSDKAEEKKQGDLEKAVTKYSTTLDKAGVPEFDSALSIAEGRLAKHKPGELPGYGRFESSVPNWAANSEQQMSRSDMQGAANILLKARSGAAVTDSEMRRFLTEVATGSGMSEEAMRHGWANVRRQFDAKRAGLAASASPEVQGEFISRGGKDFRVHQPAAPDTSADDALINKYLKK